MKMNYLYLFDFNKIYRNCIGTIKVEGEMAKNARSVISKRDNYIFEQINLIKKENMTLEEIIVVFDFKEFIKYHKMLELKDNKDFEIEICKLDEDIETNNKIKIKVVDFLKSNSMSKECQVYYINSECEDKYGNNLYQELSKRVFFGFSDEECILSKLYAYSGTLCSDCYLLKDIKINEDEIVVVKDKTIVEKKDCIMMLSEHFIYKKYEDVNKEINHKEVNDILAYEELIAISNSLSKEINSNVSSNIRKMIDDFINIIDDANFSKKLGDLLQHYSNIYASHEKVKWERIILYDYPIEINLFDGEGLISKEFGMEIRNSLSKLLGHNRYENSTSFQIRLPYIKGMVHMCDIKHFFQEKGLTSINHLVKCCHQPNDLNKVKIILTESQFKALTFMKNGKSQIKTVSDYIKLINQYKFSFGVIDADKKRESDRCKLEYQFLSTLPLSEEENDILFINTAKYINLLCKQEEVIKELSLDDTKVAKNEYSIYEVNPNFYLSTKSYYDRRNEMFKRLKYECIFGKIPVYGQRRYLSSDLLELLYFLTEEKFSSEKWINKNSFYAPNFEFNFSTAVFLRSPHYSRNEIVMLSRTRNNERDKYFKDLSGIVMINPRSLAADRLGGADYDGDTVLVVTEKIIKDSVKRHLINVENFEYKYLPCKIPSINGEKYKYSEYEKRLTCFQNTFSSRVGQLSNVAFKEACTLYKNPEFDENQLKMAEFTILNGLEIDSAKSGRKPSISEYLIRNKNDEEESRSAFLDKKSKYDEHHQIRNYKDFISALLKDEESRVLKMSYSMCLINLEDNRSFVEKNIEIPLEITNDYLKILAIVKTYCKINKVLKTKTAQAEQNRKNKLSRISNQIDQILNYKHDNVCSEDLLNEFDIDNDTAYALLCEYITKDKYHFMKLNERKEYLDDNFLELEDNIKSLLKDFSYEGYRLIYLLLQYRRISVDEIKTYYSNKDNIIVKNHLENLNEKDKKKVEEYCSEFEKNTLMLVNDKAKKYADIKWSVIDYFAEQASNINLNEIKKLISIKHSKIVYEIFFKNLCESLTGGNSK